MRPATPFPSRLDIRPSSARVSEDAARLKVWAIRAVELLVKIQEDTSEPEERFELLPRPIFRANGERARSEAIQRRRRTSQRRNVGFSRRRSMRRPR